MTKKLKDFIDENRREFDDDLPPEATWSRIERSMGLDKPAKRFSLRTIYRWSAAAAVFFIAAITIYLVTEKRNNPVSAVIPKEQVNPAPGNGNDIGKMEPAFALEAKKMYQAIEQQQQQLKSMAARQPELYSQFAQDLAALDSSYRVLKAQAIRTPSRQIIIKAMMQNLQLQAELLSKQLMIIDEFNNNKTIKNEKDNNRSI